MRRSRKQYIEPSGSRGEFGTWDACGKDVIVLSHVLANSYLRLLYSSLAEQGVQVVGFTPRRLIFGRYDVFHLHWPEAWIGRSRVGDPFKFILYVIVARIRRRVVVWTCHNVRPHEAYHTGAQRMAWRLTIRLLDGTFHLSEETLDVAMRELPPIRNKRYIVTPHGHWLGFYGEKVGRDLALEQLDIYPEAYPVIGWLGAIRQYKGLGDLLRAFSNVDLPGARLVVAGEPLDHSVVASLEEFAERDSRIIRRVKYLRESEVCLILSAIDLAVLPFRDVHNSGSAILMLSYGIPILVPDLPAFRYLERTFGAEWVRIYSGTLTADILHEQLRAYTRPTAAPDLSPLDWEAIARDTALFYRSLIRDRTRVRSRRPFRPSSQTVRRKGS